MPYDEQLVGRVRGVLAEKRNVEEKKMFGGLTFMLRGNMACGVERERLMVRVGPDAYDDALGQPHAQIDELYRPPHEGLRLRRTGGAR